MADRKPLKNPNGLILGIPGSGKPFSAKREITNVFLLTGDDIAIIDLGVEYFPLVSHLGGQVVKIATTSTDQINPKETAGEFVLTDQTGAGFEKVEVKIEKNGNWQNVTNSLTQKGNKYFGQVEIAENSGLNE